MPALTIQWSGVGVINQSAPPPPPNGFAEWIAASAVPAHPGGPRDDADGDGLANLLGFALASSPAAANEAPGRLIVWPFGDTAYLAYLYPRRKILGDVEISVEVAANLFLALDLGSVERATVDRGAVPEYVVVRSVLLLSAVSAQFIRVRVAQP
jgi:hypothetical protein